MNDSKENIMNTSITDKETIQHNKQQKTEKIEIPDVSFFPSQSFGMKNSIIDNNILFLSEGRYILTLRQNFIYCWK